MPVWCGIALRMQWLGKMVGLPPTMCCIGDSPTKLGQAHRALQKNSTPATFLKFLNPLVCFNLHNRALNIDTLGSEVLGSLFTLYGEGAPMKKAVRITAKSPPDPLSPARSPIFFMARSLLLVIAIKQPAGQ
ncbi:uncharacterized protein LACBIDRAFT_322433 [Laccaria bicolor S238N-H82]|uniref:Predicted protein n=1 Tax=Laccaria bicolor (strain S238N-H82 / ATCC MYA-4686) TaxID=486041 RepID=B0CW97_LACBS|nr:uncharacterized protein LACBIDRAFT_322433 [Laccaria bicolor S238N-H82]EDR13030.1 predicted protein [Laccaria bicolor S238N-H82]|eukprot:XP_001875528.1 predicted protein [Laccaria bicolor S238N-H82]